MLRRTFARCALNWSLKVKHNFAVQRTVYVGAGVDPFVDTVFTSYTHPEALYVMNHLQEEKGSAYVTYSVAEIQ